MSAVESHLIPVPEAAPAPRPDLHALLEDLEAEERAVSRQRRVLHDRIDLSVDDRYREIFREQERELSKRRRELHEQIDALRAERAALYGRPGALRLV